MTTRAIIIGSEHTAAIAPLRAAFAGIGWKAEAGVLQEAVEASDAVVVLVLTSDGPLPDAALDALAGRPCALIIANLADYQSGISARFYAEREGIDVLGILHGELALAEAGPRLARWTSPDYEPRPQKTPYPQRFERETPPPVPTPGVIDWLRRALSAPRVC